jgi:diguanylate cyclase (GGDEF)-like protein
VDPHRTEPSTLSLSPDALPRLPPIPSWWFYALMPLLHFASYQLTLLLAVTAKNEVVVWLPNAVLLASLLHYQGQRAVVLSLLAFTSEFVGNIQLFSPLTASVLCSINLLEVLFAYALLRRTGSLQILGRVQDFGRFLVAGPVFGALLAGLLAGLALPLLPQVPIHGNVPFLALTRLWWFSDALGLLIYTPLLLAFAQPPKLKAAVTKMDLAVLLGTLALAVQVFRVSWDDSGTGNLTPTLLLPSALYVAVRLNLRWAITVTALISLATASAVAHGHMTVGSVPRQVVIMWAQQLILTLCIVGIGFGILLQQLRTNEHDLETKVHERTRELELMNAQLAVLSATDGLTGIANRRAFDDIFTREWRRTTRTGESLALVMLDVDYFKSYNDHYGHLSGDDCLREIAQLLAAHYRRTGDVVARFGGEEFVLLTRVIDREVDAAYLAAEGVRQALQALALPHANSPFGVVTASIGVAVGLPTNDTLAQAMLQEADKALYQAKAEGRNCTRLYAVAAGAMA